LEALKLSGYGNQNWQDPYQGWSGGSPYGDQAWQDPYAAGAGASYGPPPPPANHGSAVGALVCNIIATLFCCLGFSIAGIITSAIAMSQNQTDPESARKLTKWSWGLFAANMGLVVLGIIAYLIVFFAVLESPSGGGYSGGCD
jgi:hypothetical protein